MALHCLWNILTGLVFNAIFILKSGNRYLRAILKATMLKYFYVVKTQIVFFVILYPV